MYSLKLRLFLFLLAYTCTSAFANQSVNDYYEHASKLYFAEDYNGALIQLKNALQIDTEHVPSLALAGRTYLQLKEPAAAEEFLIKARVLGADRSSTNLRLAEAYKQQAKYRQIIDELSIDELSSADAAELLGYTAEAWLGLGNEPEAAANIEQANRLSPNALRPNLARALLSIRLNEPEKAVEVAKMATESYPLNAEAWNSYASAFHALGNLQQALKLYSKAIELDDRLVNARLARVGLLIDLWSFNETLPDLNYLQEAYPFEPRAAYFRGLVYAKLASPDNDYQEKYLAEFKKCTEVISRLPRDLVALDPQINMVAALAYYSQGEYEAAKKYLSHYLSNAPFDLGANRLMGNLLIKLKDPLAAIKTIKPALQTYPLDAQLNSLLAAAYSQSGQHEKATQILEGIEQSGLGNTQISNKLAISRLQSGYTSAGIEGLNQIFSEEPGQLQTGFSLVIAQLQNNQYEEALRNAQKLEAQDPDNITIQNILGVSLQAAGYINQARLVFRKLVGVRPDFLPGQINYAKSEERAGDIAAARRVLSELQNKHPTDAAVLLALAQLERRQGQLVSATKLAETAKQLNPSNLDIRSLLIDLYLASGDNESAESLGLDTAATNNNSFDSSALLAQVYSRVGKHRQATSIYRRMIKEAGFNTESLYKIAQHLIKNQSWSAARHALYKAIEGNPHHLPSKIAYIRVQQALGDHQDALKRALNLMESVPGDINGYLLAGNSSMQLQNYKAAEDYYSRGLKIQPQAPLMIGLYQSLMAQGERQKAGKIIEGYWNKDAFDPTAGAVYSEFLIAQKQWLDAKKVLSRLLEERYDNPTLLNNMAYVLDQLGDATALTVIRDAHELDPDNPIINDTLGWLLVKANAADEGLKYLRQAVTRLADNPEIRYHLAEALYRIGRHQESKNELVIALQSTGEFEGKPQAERLLKNMTPSAP